MKKIDLRPGNMCIWRKHADMILEVTNNWFRLMRLWAPLGDVTYYQSGHIHQCEKSVYRAYCDSTDAVKIVSYANEKK